MGNETLCLENIISSELHSATELKQLYCEYDEKNLLVDC